LAIEKSRLKKKTLRKKYSERKAQKNNHENQIGYEEVLSALLHSDQRKENYG